MKISPRPRDENWITSATREELVDRFVVILESFDHNVLISLSHIVFWEIVHYFFVIVLGEIFNNLLLNI